MFVARSDALALALVPALLAFAGTAGAAGALNLDLPASELGHTSACDACCACTHYLSSTPRRANRHRNTKKAQVVQPLRRVVRVRGATARRGRRLT